MFKHCTLWPPHNSIDYSNLLFTTLFKSFLKVKWWKFSGFSWSNVNMISSSMVLNWKSLVLNCWSDKTKYWAMWTCDEHLHCYLLAFYRQNDESVDQENNNIHLLIRKIIDSCNPNNKHHSAVLMNDLICWLRALWMSLCARTIIQYIHTIKCISSS